MDKPSLLDDLQDRLSAVLRDSPAADLQRNLRAVLDQGLQRLDLVSREEFDTYVQWAGRLRERIARLEARIDELERARHSAPSPGGTADPR